MSLLKRYRRWATPLLAVAAALLCVYAAIFVFDIEPALVAEISFYSFLAMLVMVACAGIFIGLLILLRRLYKPRDER